MTNRGKPFKGFGSNKSPGPMTPIVEGRYDRFCVWCGEVNLKQAHLKSEKCSNGRCGMRVPARINPSLRSNFVHCANCDAYIHNHFSCCNICKHETAPGKIKQFLQRKRLLMERLARKRPSAFKPHATFSMADLGGDIAFGTPKKKKLKEAEVDWDNELTDMDLLNALDEAEEEEEVKAVEKESTSRKETDVKNSENDPIMKTVVNTGPISEEKSASPASKSNNDDPLNVQDGKTDTPPEGGESTTLVSDGDKTKEGDKDDEETTS